MIFWQKTALLFSRPKEAIKRGVNSFSSNPPLYVVGLVAVALGVVGELKTVGPNPYHEDVYSFGLAAFPLAWMLFNPNSPLRNDLVGQGIGLWIMASAFGLLWYALIVTGLLIFGEFLAETLVG